MSADRALRSYWDFVDSLKKEFPNEASEIETLMEGLLRFRKMVKNNEDRTGEGQKIGKIWDNLVKVKNLPANRFAELGEKARSTIEELGDTDLTKVVEDSINARKAKE